ncbi:ABC transporter substrate-binding protein [Bacillus sp. FJAT-28004]|uniref:ABC transporter substrate-binding protein n=1 Tax=Bacillus sp. FJAT-28004 TaxID=1679165 RepID=UPI0006B41130|nr:extracellular solute-binding protein [Bacillus sp. FJAT-28004]
MKVLSKFVIPIVIIALMVTGCSFGGDKNEKETEQTALKVMYYDEGSFFQEYGMVFSALFPNVEIDVVENQKMYQGDNKDMDAALAKFIEEEQPDILMLDTEQYKKLALDGKLYDLDAIMEKEKYEAEGLIPGMLDYLRELGGGQVFGMTPSFYSQVLFYNKDLFEKYQIELPKDRMSWNETIQLARRFPTEGDVKERVYGLKMGYGEDLFEVASMFAASENVNYVNAAQKQMTINTDSWKMAFQQAIDAVDSNALFFESMNNQESNMSQTYEDYLLRDPFISGRLAMTISDTNYINQIKQASEYEKVKDKVVKNWDIVTVPVGEQNPDQSNMMSFNNIFAIRTDSPNKDVAWKFLSYVTSDDFARVKAKSNNYNGMPVRTKYITDTEGRNFAAFYNLKPSTFNSYKDFDKLPQSFWGDFRGAAKTELDKVKKKEQELDAALDILQVKGQEMLLKEDPVPTEGAATSESGGASSSVVTTE